MNGDDLLKNRQQLASYLRDAMAQARKSGMTQAEAMKQVGSDVAGMEATTGLSRKQMADYATRSFLTPENQQPNTQPDSGFAQQEQEARARSRASGAFGGPNTTATPSGGLTAAQTPRLAALEAMQSQPIGTTGALLRGTSPTGGTPIGKRSNMPSGGDIMREAFAKELERRELEKQRRTAEIEALKRGSGIGTTFTAGQPSP